MLEHNSLIKHYRSIFLNPYLRQLLLESFFVKTFPFAQCLEYDNSFQTLLLLRLLFSLNRSCIFFQAAQTVALKCRWFQIYQASGTRYCVKRSEKWRSLFSAIQYRDKLK